MIRSALKSIRHLSAAVMFCGIVLVSIVRSENFYVRPNGSVYGLENGSDWNNAFNGLAGILWGDGNGLAGAGDTLFIAGGLYTTNLIVAENGNQNNWIVIRRATEQIHGTDTGWESTWDSLVHLSRAYINLQDRSYVEVDGATEWGIKISGLDSTMRGVAAILIGADVPAYNSEYITIRNIELIGPGQHTCDGTRGIGVYGNHIRVNHLYISHIKAHEYSGACIRLGDHDGVLIENSYIYNVQNAAAEECNGHNPHNTHIALYGPEQSDNIIIRNNYLFQEYDDNKVNGGYVIGFGYVSGNVDVYNNVFFNVNNPSLTAQNPVPSVEGSRINFFNNTVVGCRTMVWGTESSFNMINNIFCNKGFDPSTVRWPYPQANAVLDSNNVFYLDQYTIGYANGSNIVLPEGVDPFEQYDQQDITVRFHLRSDSPARDQGKDISGVFTNDIDGHNRSDGKWDIGAYEFLEPGSISQEPLIPSESSLFQNYPNPFNPSTEISYKLKAKSEVKIIVYDILGREIKTLVNEVKSAGTHTVKWNGTDREGKVVPSGTYFYQIRWENGKASSKKMIYLR